MLTAKRRDALYEVIRECAIAVGIGRAEVEEVDRMNVYWAAMEARRRAGEALPELARHVLVDGRRRIAGCGVVQTPVIDGDSVCASIAAASIMAKVTRDSPMREYGRTHPEYGFEQHKGYGTPAHLEVLGRLGPSAFHRRSFRPVSMADHVQLSLALS